MTFLAVAAPRPERAIDPSVYYRLRRPIGVDGRPVFAIPPWSGAPSPISSHCFIHYAAIGADNLRRSAAERRARIDWWENSGARAHAPAQAELNPLRLPTLGRNAWGPHRVRRREQLHRPWPLPTAHRFADERPVGYEHPNGGEGRLRRRTIAVRRWGARSCSPGSRVDALRNHRSLRPMARHWSSARRGQPVRCPRTGRGTGSDAFNLGTGWSQRTALASTKGRWPAIENRRSG